MCLKSDLVVAVALVSAFLDISADVDGHEGLKTLAHELARTNSPIR